MWPVLLWGPNVEVGVFCRFDALAVRRRATRQSASGVGGGEGGGQKPTGNPWRLRLAVALSYRINESPSTGRACLEFGVTDTSNGGVPPLDRDVLVY